MAIRHRMGEVAKTLLSYIADVAVRGHPSFGSQENGDVGSTVTELASEDNTTAPVIASPSELAHSSS